MANPQEFYLFSVPVLPRFLNSVFNIHPSQPHAHIFPPHWPHLNLSYMVKDKALSFEGVLTVVPNMLSILDLFFFNLIIFFIQLYC